MSTLNDLIASIHTSLHSYSGTQEQVTWLTSGCDTDDLTLVVASSDTLLRGIAEVDDELLYVHTTDSTGAVLAPFGRGFRGTEAASHAVNAMVTFDPVFPRAEIRRAIDQCIEGLFPMLWQLKQTTLTFTGTQVGFSLPADCEGVTRVEAHNAGDIADYWMPVQRWTYDPDSPLTNGRALNLFEDVMPTSTIRVTYRAKFGPFTAGTDTLASAGLTESMADLILYCVTSRMVRFLDPARLQVATVENLGRSTVVASGDAAKIANQLYTMYQQRLAEERSKLLALHPPTMNFAG